MDYGCIVGAGDKASQIERASWMEGVCVEGQKRVEGRSLGVGGRVKDGDGVGRLQMHDDSIPKVGEDTSIITDGRWLILSRTYVNNGNVA